MLFQDPSQTSAYGAVPTTGVPIYDQNQQHNSPWGMPPTQNMNNNNFGGGGFTTFPPPPPPPPGFGSPSSSCVATSTSLDQHLRESSFGANQAIFNCYFVPGVMPPRCIACNRLIAEHPSSTGAGTMTPVVVFPGAGIGIGGVAGTRPDITSNGSVDTFVDGGLVVFRWIGGLLLLIGIVLFIVFGATFDPNEFGAGTRFIPAGMLTFMGIVFTLITKRIVVTFDKSARVIKYSSSRLPWICFSTSSTFTFADVTGVEVRATNVSVNKVPQSDVVIRVRNGNDVEVCMTGAWGATAVANRWSTYLREIGCSL
jgi:hypothetical protein